MLFARLGTPYCPECSIPISTQTLDEIVAKIFETTAKRFLIAAPLIIEVGQNYDDLWERLRTDGYSRVRIDGTTYSLESPPEIDRRRKHDVELIIDRLTANDRARLAEGVETALSIGGGIMHVIEASDVHPEPQWKRTIHSQHLSCSECGRSFERLSPHNFSANSPLGWCPNCEGLGTQWGTNPALFLEDSKLTLIEGAVQMFPAWNNPLGKAMLTALANSTEIPLDVPFDQLDARHRRLIFHGTGNTWHRAEIKEPQVQRSVTCGFDFQYKGLYPAMEEMMRLVPSLRMQHIELIGEV